MYTDDIVQVPHCSYGKVVLKMVGPTRGQTGVKVAYALKPDKFLAYVCL